MTATSAVEETAELRDPLPRDRPHDQLGDEPGEADGARGLREREQPARRRALCAPTTRRRGAADRVVARGQPVTVSEDSDGMLARESRLRKVQYVQPWYRITSGRKISAVQLITVSV